MKKILITSLTLLLALNLTGCVKKESLNIDNNGQNKTNNETQEQDELKEWGNPEVISVSANGTSAAVRIHSPSISGIIEGTGIISSYSCGDNVHAECDVVLDTYVEGISPDVSNLDEVFPAYETQLLNIYDVYYGSHDHKNASLTILSKEYVTINDYEMCKFIGVHSYIYDDYKYENKFVAYATKTKRNNGIVYWLVEDNSKDQLNFEIAEEDAYNMTKTFKEE